MRRREFITLLGGVAAWPIAAPAQQAPRPVIGLLGFDTAAAQSEWTAALLQRLRELGWSEDRNLTIEYRWGEGRTERFSEIAAEFVLRKVTIILTHNTPPTLAAKQATSSIPIVFATAGDPIGAGIVASLARPGGNITGLSSQTPDAAGKKLELFRQVVPGLHRLATLADVDNPYVALDLRQIKESASTLGIEVATFEIRRSEELESAFDALKQRVDALYVLPVPLLFANRGRISALALSARLPTLHGVREYVEAGGLLRASGRDEGRVMIRPSSPLTMLLSRHTRRREFITLLGGAVAGSWPVVAYAQQPSMPVIGFLGSAAAKQWAPLMGAFLEGLSEVEIVVGRDVTIEYRWAEGQYDRLPSLAASLVQRQVSVIAALTTPSAVAAKAATGTIPIVFSTIGDPVQIGLVASLRRPGGNITGATYLNVEVGPKLLELLHEVVPTATTVAALVNPTNPNAEILTNSLQVAAGTLGLELHVLKASTERDINTAFETLIQQRVGGLVVPSDVFLITHEEQLAALALRHRVPAISQTRAFAAAGGLMSYAGSALGAYRQAGAYTGRVLKGEKPADLPVQQTTKVELIVNLKTAKALGLVIPLPLLARADEVIE